ncbi:MAG: shikimate dehydrogenase [Rikenellaceae bacterium]
MRKFGLIGRTLKHSFSGEYFAKKFISEGIEGCSYSLFELADISEVERMISENPELEGFNITIPYKRDIMPYLTALSTEAQSVGAVNCVKIEGGKLTGHNTDVRGFSNALTSFLDGAKPQRALILGTGGASQAVQYSLGNMGILFDVVSRGRGQADLTYEDITGEVIARSQLIINSTPLGTFPDVDSAPQLPYELLTSDHFLFDLVYNPPTTAFMKRGAQQWAKTMNGYAMLVGQAEESWSIWNR